MPRGGLFFVECWISEQVKRREVNQTDWWGSVQCINSQTFSEATTQKCFIFEVRALEDCVTEDFISQPSPQGHLISWEKLCGTQECYTLQEGPATLVLGYKTLSGPHTVTWEIGPAELYRTHVPPCAVSDESSRTAHGGIQNFCGGKSAPIS